MFKTKTRQRSDRGNASAAGTARPFDRQLRADSRLNITTRLCWLMAALSAQSGYSSMAAERMAAELATTAEAVRQARQKLVRLGLFDKGERWRFKRRLMPGENSQGWPRRVRADRRLDLTARAVWLLCAATRIGPRALSQIEVATALGITPKNAARTLRDMARLGLFSVTPGGGRGHKSVYSRRVGADCVTNYLIPIANKEWDNEDDDFDLDEYCNELRRRDQPHEAAK